jgi:signal recognition particle subunit SRP72
LEDDAEADLRINTGAIDAQLEWVGFASLVSKRKPGREDLEAFETAYNAACGSIARGELGQGDVLLKRARDLCNALDDLSEEDKQAELLPIKVQQVYVLARLGKLDEAEKLANGIDTKQIPDPSTRHIAQVNQVAVASKPSNPFLTQRLVAKDLDSLKPDYPFQLQSFVLRRDQYAADLQSLKFDGTADSTASFIAKQVSPNLDSFTNSLSAVNAAAHAKVQTGKEALKVILPLLDKRPNDVGLILTIVQLYVLTGNSESATKLMESFLDRLENSGNSADLDVRFAPGLVGTKVGLHANQGQRGGEQRELARAATHWRRKSKGWPTGVINLLKAAGSALLESTNPEDKKLANEIFQDLQKRDENDRYAAAGVLATSLDPPSSQSTQFLTPIDRLIAGIDIDQLENAGIPQPPSAPGAEGRKRPAEDTKPKKAKKIRKSRMPKDYDPNETPDPERWLPLRDRSTYRPKGKKGKARANLLSQGAAPTGDSDGSRPNTPGGEVIKQKQQPGGGGKKKKGKGSKW